MTIYQRTLPMLRQCSLCGAMRKTLYEVPLGDNLFLFCSKMEAEVGQENYMKNKSLEVKSNAPADTRSTMATDIMTESQHDQIS